jgi:galactokinase
MKRVLDCVQALSDSNFALVGELINQSHISLRDDYTVSCPELDTAVEAALAAGALGSRMVGGGFGGSAIALLKAKDAELIKSEIKSAFMKSRYKSPRFFSALPSAGAGVVN